MARVVWGGGHNHLQLHDLAHQLERRDLLARPKLGRRREEREDLDVLGLLGVLARAEEGLGEHLAQRAALLGVDGDHLVQQPPLRVGEALGALEGRRHLLRRCEESWGER